MGIVYHGNYFNYFEVARTEFLRENGIRYRDLETEGIYLVVVDIGAKFKKRILYDELIQITIRVTKASGVRMGFEYEIRPEGSSLDDPAHVIGHTLLACVNGDGRPRGYPPSLKDALAKMTGD